MEVFIGGTLGRSDSSRPVRCAFSLLNNIVSHCPAQAATGHCSGRLFEGKFLMVKTFFVRAFLVDTADAQLKTPS